MNQINKTTFQQLGGAKVTAMTGAKVMIDDSTNTLTLSGVKGSSKKVTHVKIEYTETDTYTITFYNIRSMKITKVATVKDVYSDALVSTIETNTGLYLSL